jgi:hypothetical protein
VTEPRPPKRKRKPRPARPKVINKAPDLLPHDDVAQALAWLGKGYPTPSGPPWPWEALPDDERARFDAAVKRLVDGFVPTLAAQTLCWSGGDWRATCRQVTDAAEIQIFPERQHIRLIPRPARAVLFDHRGRPLLPN